MENRFVIAELGAMRVQEWLKEAEQDRLASLADGDSPEPIWKRIAGWFSGAAATAPAAAEAIQAGGRIGPDATGAGEVPSL